MEELVKWQEKKRKKLYKLFGELPEGDYPVRVIKRIEEEREKYILEKLVLDLNGYELVPAYFVKPKNLKNRVPAIVFNHSHGGKYYLGKDEFIEGNSYMAVPPYAEVITSLGFVGICIDHLNFGERSGRDELDLFKELIWKGRVLWGLMVFDSLKVVDYLMTREEVDKERIATIGMSMGSTMAWYLSALDKRIKVCIDICCLTDFEELIKTRGISGHGIYYFVPSLLKFFSTSDINSLIAPRPHLSVAGAFDRLTPLDGLKKIDRELKNIYKKFGKEENWQLKIYNVGHRETFQMRSDIIEFLLKHI
ncbi:MAG TPA: alpha/beta hydrolase family protein [bacterium]|nr:alpha/beta hydrolase family protein [bacterium]HOM26043.1 alpha/beta hydrolase family protein [bacterium]